MIPYLDENGTVQQPVFGISSFGGRDIRKWSERLYEELVEAKKQSSQVTDENVPKYSENDPIAVLKLRLAKGEKSPVKNTKICAK